MPEWFQGLVLSLITVASGLQNRSWGRNLIDHIGIYCKELKNYIVEIAVDFRWEKLISFLLLSCVGVQQQVWEPNQLFPLGPWWCLGAFVFSSIIFSLCWVPNWSWNWLAAGHWLLPPVVTMVMTLILGYMSKFSTSPSGTPQGGLGRMSLPFFLTNGGGLWRKHRLLHNSTSMFTTYKRMDMGAW